MAPSSSNCPAIDRSQLVETNWPGSLNTDLCKFCDEERKKERCGNFLSEINTAALARVVEFVRSASPGMARSG